MKKSCTMQQRTWIKQTNWRLWESNRKEEKKNMDNTIEVQPEGIAMV
jgi:hypothetical protein